MYSMSNMILKDLFALIFKRPRIKYIKGAVAVLGDDIHLPSEKILIGMGQLMGRFFLPSSSFIRLPGNSSPERCRRNAEWVLSSLSPAVELIIAVGPLSARALSEVSRETGSKKPTIFLNVQDPISTGLVSQNKRSDMFFGFVDNAPPEDYLTPLPTLLPDTQRVIVLYHAEGGSVAAEHEQKSVMRFFNERGISYTPVGIPSFHSLSYHFRQVLKGLEEKDKTVVVVMPHMVLLSNILLISRMASLHDVMLYSLETEAVRYEYDPMLSTTVDSYSFGQKVMSHALDSIDVPHGATRRMIEYPMKRCIMIQRNTKMSYHLPQEKLPFSYDIFWC